MSESLNERVTLDALNQFFSDLIALADFQAEVPQLRPEVEALRVEAMNLGGLAHNQAHLRIYLSDLVLSGTLTPAQGLDLGQRLDEALETEGMMSSTDPNVDLMTGLKLPMMIRARALKMLNAIRTAASLGQLMRAADRAEGFAVGIETVQALNPIDVENLYLVMEDAAQARRAELQEHE